MKSVNCKFCQNTFNTQPAWLRRGRGKFCKRECYSLWQKENKLGLNNAHWQGGSIGSKCLNCRKEFKVIKAEFKKGWGKFCSRKCHGLWQISTRIKISCLLCVKEFFVIPARIKLGVKFCSQSCRTLWFNRNGLKRSDTNIEKLLEQELKSRNILFEKQYVVSLARTIVDFMLPNKIAVYADGDYWHGLEKVKERDSRQNKLLVENGYLVFRFSEKEIETSAKECVGRIIL